MFRRARGWTLGVVLAVTAVALVQPTHVRAEPFAPEQRVALTAKLRSAALTQGGGTLDPCSHAAQSLWYAASEFAGIVPGIGTLAKIAIQSSKVARFSYCRVGNQETLTTAYLLDQIEIRAGEIVDAELREQLELGLAAQVVTLNEELRNIAEYESLSELEKSRLISVVDGIARAAEQLELQSTGLRWPVLPACAMAATLKGIAYNLEYEMLPDGPTKTNLALVVMPNARERSIARLIAHERDYIAYVQESKLVREYSEEKRGSRWYYSIRAEATRGRSTVYSKSWSCSRSVFKPRGCKNRGSRRDEYFNAARKAALEVREELAKSIDVPFMRFKNSIGFYDFVHETRRWKEGFPLFNQRSNLCLLGQPLGSSGKLSTQIYQSWDRNDCPSTFSSTYEASSMTWRFVPRTGQIESSLYNRCLDDATNGQPDHYIRIYGMRCQSGDPETGQLGEKSGQAWGIHPLGFIVHLASGECMTAGNALNDSVVLRKPCEWRLPTGDEGWWAPGSDYAIIEGYGKRYGDPDVNPGQLWFPHFHEADGAPTPGDIEVGPGLGFCMTDEWCSPGEQCIDERCE